MNVRERRYGLGTAILAGSLAGFAASLPMAVIMIGLHRMLPKSRVDPAEPYHPLPPKQITREMAERAGVPEATRGGRKWDAATWAGHLGYGAATGAAYPLTTGWLPLPAAARGAAFAMLVWAGSYMGWLPAFKILPPAVDQPARRNAVMILSHLAWGGLLAVLAEKAVRLRRGSQQRIIQL